MQDQPTIRIPLLHAVTLAAVVGVATCHVANGQQPLPDWVPAMRQVAAAGSGEAGVLLNVGDSISYSMAYFAPLQSIDRAKAPREVVAAAATLDAFLKRECYRWKGPEHGNASGKTAGWGLQHLDGWIESLQPQLAVVMFGTNDIRQGTLEQHAQNLRQLVEGCLDQGVVVIMTTIPPMDGHDDKVPQAVATQRQIAAELNVPLIDFYAHVMNRRGADWNGKLPQFSGFEMWQAPTLISKDGVHLSNPDRWRGDYSEEGLCRNGNTLRNYLTLLAVAEVIEVVFKGRPPSTTMPSILGANPPRPKNLPAIATTAGLAAPSEDQPRDVAAASDLRQPLLAPPQPAWLPAAPPLPPPTGEVVEVGTVAELYAAVDAVAPGGTILLADGLYRMPRSLRLATDRMSLRGQSGQRTHVLLDFAESQHHEGVVISHSQGVTVADLSIANVRQNGIKINSDLGVDGVTIYNVVSHNVWQRHVKGPQVPDEDGQPAFVEDCQISHCLFYNDRPKRRGDEPWEDENPQFQFNYVGGIDVMNARGWRISNNVFTGIRGATGEARGGIFLWHNTTDCLIEANVLFDCDSGICLGNSSARGERRHANGCIVRNNFVVRCPENSILADHTRDCIILHNSVHDPESRLGRLLRVVHANDGLIVANNLFSGPRIAIESESSELTMENNLIRPVETYFVDP
ncbi:MAG: hypothetical protein EA381_07660, partial [Planctomycetaceae bacterium]